MKLSMTDVMEIEKWYSSLSHIDDNHKFKFPPCIGDDIHNVSYPADNDEYKWMLEKMGGQVKLESDNGYYVSIKSYLDDGKIYMSSNGGQSLEIYSSNDAVNKLINYTHVFYDTCPSLNVSKFDKDWHRDPSIPCGMAMMRRNWKKDFLYVVRKINDQS